MVDVPLRSLETTPLQQFRQTHHMFYDFVLLDRGKEVTTDIEITGNAIHYDLLI